MRFSKFTLEELISFTKELKVLYVEDNREAQEAMLYLLKNFFNDIEAASNGEEGFAKFQNGDFDLVISDIRMPKLDGIEMSRLIREVDCTIPIVIVTAHQESELLLKCIDVGVSSYLLKPINFKQLKKVLKQICEKVYYMKKIEEYEHSLEELVRVRTQELEEIKAQLEEMANRDPLTNLFNRRYLHDVSKTLCSISQREEQVCSLLMIDIDKFKNINDTYGHIVGDRVIQFLADIFREMVRNSDVAIRFGGEEFIILLPNTNLKGATSIAEKIREYVQNQEFVIDKEKEETLGFTVSIGVSECDCREELDINKALSSVDEALYKAKRAGRNRVEVFHEMHIAH